MSSISLVIRICLGLGAWAVAGPLWAVVDTTEPPASVQPQQAPTSADPAPRIIRGNDRIIGAPKVQPTPDGAANAFRFEDAPVLDVAHIILRQVLNVDYIVHPPVVGSVTMSTRGAVPADQALALLETALQANGLVLARDARGVFHVGRPESLKGVVAVPRVPTAAAALAPGHGVVVVPLQYVGAAEMAAILRPVLPADALNRIDNVRNLLVLTGSRPQVEGWLELVNVFDVDLLKGMSVALFPLKHATAKEVDAALRLLNPVSAALPTPGATPSRPASAAAASAAAAAASASATASSPLSDAFPLHGAIRVLPIERLNSVLVVTPRAHYLDEAKRWIEKLDQPGMGSAEPQLFVYPVQNGSARHLAEVLSGIFGGSTTAGSTGAGSGVAPGLMPVTGTTGGATGGISLGGARTGAATSAAGSFANNNTRTSVISATLGQNGPRVVADEANNALLIYSTGLEFKKIEATLARLDVPPTQVMIEASIIEVTLNDELRYGLQWTFNDSARNGLSGTGVISSAAGGALGGALAGFSYTLTNPLGQVRAVLNALATKSLVNIISNPSLMVLDNHVAQITVGNQQPVRSSQTITDGGNVTSSIQYKDTGVMLSVQPSVNAGDMVTLNIAQAVTDVGEVDEATGQRAFLQRQINSKVAVRSGEAIVLGGLIRDNSTNGKAGLPGLQDIPVLGKIFGSNNSSSNRTELLVVLTPRVVRTQVDARAVSDELRDRMKRLPLPEASTPWPGQPTERLP